MDDGFKDLFFELTAFPGRFFIGMKVTINQKLHEFTDQMNIEQILSELKIQQDFGAAVALNNTVISKSKFASTFVSEGDKLEIIHAVAGG